MAKQMTEKDRYFIEIQLKKHTPVEQIAKDLHRAPSTIYREIKKGTCIQRDSEWRDKKVYLYDLGQRRHNEAKHRKGSKKKLMQDNDFLSEVSWWILERKYSPEAALYKVKDKKCCIKTIYNYIHAGYLKGVKVNNLPYAKKKKKKKENETRKTLPRGRSIEERPDIINERVELGHWEMDTVYSSKDDLTCLLVLSERVTREELIFQIKDRTAKSVIRALDRYERKIGTPAFCNKFKSITCDNGVEFSDWKSIERSCRTKGNRTIVYFCHPYSSWERGTNENINRMIRRFIPKGDDIGLYSPAEIQQIENWINDYPRHIFNGLSAREFAKLIG